MLRWVLPFPVLHDAAHAYKAVLHSRNGYLSPDRLAIYPSGRVLGGRRLGLCHGLELLLSYG